MGWESVDSSVKKFIWQAKSCRVSAGYGTKTIFLTLATGMSIFPDGQNLAERRVCALGYGRAVGWCMVS